jgi:hypothetical protein
MWSSDSSLSPVKRTTKHAPSDWGLTPVTGGRSGQSAAPFQSTSRSPESYSRGRHLEKNMSPSLSAGSIGLHSSLGNSWTNDRVS